MTGNPDSNPGHTSATAPAPTTVEGPVGPTHAGVLAALHHHCFPEPWDQPTFARMLAEPGSFGLIACQGPCPAGLVLCRAAGDEAEVLTLGVQPSAQRRGVGRALLNRALVLAAERGAARMVLEVAADNRAALALYSAAGFTAVGQRRSYYLGPTGITTDALILACPLAATRVAD
ncbi:MAG: GNAT family N-acetyltransferase [Rhodospirillales bacterium]|nr:MAG: GNAT family N-acetyltransferase [Rhodospirillales bacterium]